MSLENSAGSPPIGLSLSGGGFRASLFHLGVLKRLDELDILDRVTHISGVSGGAVTAALFVHLKRRQQQNPQYKRFNFRELEMALLGFVKANPRTRWLGVLLLRRLIYWLAPMPVRLALGQALATYAFDGFFRGYMFKDVALSSLTQGKEGLPHLIINTTGLEKGQNVYFTPTYVGPDKALAFDPRGGQSIARGEVSLAFAVGASACVPAIFPPSVLPLQPAANGGAVAADPARAHLVDGGVCDNQGIGVFLTEPKVGAERVQYLIVSDASRVLDPEEDGSPPWYYFFFKPLALLSRALGKSPSAIVWAFCGRQVAC